MAEKHRTTDCVNSHFDLRTRRIFEVLVTTDLI